MELRNLGASGLRVSVVGLGCNNFGGRIGLEETRAVVDRAIERGITFFDTADIYGNRGGSESALGEVLGKRREQIVLATKFSGPMDEAGLLKGTSRRYIVTAIEASLRRLRTDWIDLYQLHFPDPLTPMEETLRALDDLVHQGKVRYIGCTNLAGWQIADAEWIARHWGLNRFISAQNEYNLLVRDVEREVLPAARAFGLGFLPYFPLASGLLTGKYAHGARPEGARLSVNAASYSRFASETNLAVADRLERFCKERGHSLLELAFSWLAAQSPVASVIAGATKPEQIDANVEAATWSLNADDLAAVGRILSDGATLVRA